MPATQTDRLAGLTASVAVKAPVKAVSTGNLTLSGLQTVGGVVLAAGDRVLVRSQSNAVENGIYVASETAWTRAKDFNGARDVVQGTLIVANFSGGAGLLYRVTTAAPVIGSTAIEIVPVATPNEYSGFDVRNFGATGDGTTDDTTSFTAARVATGGRYHLSAGTYLVDASPDVWADAFTADGNTFIKVGATTYDVSNAFCGRLRYVVISNELTWIKDAKEDDLVIGIQNNVSGRATYFNRGLSVTSDSHALQMIPTTETDIIDVLMQRSAAHSTDPAGNRFSFTFDQPNDRWLFSYATSASGAPAFDTWMECGAGLTPYLHFPGIQPQFQQGYSVKQRASGGLAIECAVDATTVRWRNKGTPANINMVFGDNSIGFLGASAITRPTVSGARNSPEAALANLLTALENLGLITDSTTAS